MKICMVVSPGGHLYQAMMLKDWWGNFSRFWITLNSPDSSYLLKDERVRYGFGPENRNVVNFFRNFILAFFILIKEKPQLIFSTGAGIAPPFFIWAKIMGIKTIYLEPYDFIEELSLTGKLVMPISTHFLVQHEQLTQKYPKAKHQGSIV